MKIRVNFKLVNSEFDKERFEWHGGEEPENRKYIWTRTLGLDDVESKTLETDVSIYLQATQKDGTKIKCKVNNLNELKCFNKDGTEERFFVSKKILKRQMYETFDNKTNTARVFFYFKDCINIGLVDDVTYIALEDFPEELKNIDLKELKTDYNSDAKITAASGGLAINR